MTDEAADIEPVEEAPPEEEVVADEPAVDPDPSVHWMEHGFYRVRDDDTAEDAAARVYGADSEGKFSTTIPPDPGFKKGDHVIRTPGVAGKVTHIQNGERPEDVLKRLGFSRSKKHLRTFYDFNGGDMYPWKNGTLVFMPEDS